MAASGKPQCHYKLAIISLRSKNKNRRNVLFHGLNWSTNLALFLTAWVLQLEISYELGTKRNRKENPSRHNDKQILSVVDVILDIVRDAEMISVISTSPLCSLSLLSSAEEEGWGLYPESPPLECFPVFQEPPLCLSEDEMVGWHHWLDGHESE